MWAYGRFLELEGLANPFESCPYVGALGGGTIEDWHDINHVLVLGYKIEILND